MATVQIPAAQQAQILVSVSQKYKIPLRALLGIYGQETAFGSNSSTSSAGAMGPFQFMPATAAQYHYPLTNTPSLEQFTQQADAFGRYLVANNPSRDPNGWAPAMRGGYTEAQAESNLAKLPGALKSAFASVLGKNYLSDQPGTPGITITPGPDTPAGALSGITGVFSAVFTWLTTPAHWLRILEFVAGAVAVFYALMQLSGANDKVTQIVTTAASKVR